MLGRAFTSIIQLVILACQLWRSLPCGTRMTCWPFPSPWPGILKGGNGNGAPKPTNPRPRTPRVLTSFPAGNIEGLRLGSPARPPHRCPSVGSVPRACGEPNCGCMGARVRVLAVRAVLRSVVKRSPPAPCASISFVLGIPASVRGHGDSRWTYGGYVRVRLEVAGTCGAVLIRGRIVRIDDRGAC